MQAVVAQQFQSTPAITGERASILVTRSVTMACFNPRPPLLASEPHNNQRCAHFTKVSIHARHYWRASRTTTGLTTPVKQFQSTPAITGERADALREQRQQIEVSIHARHYWRASLCSEVAFSSTVRFQSTPAITGERATCGLRGSGPRSSFNPRPPLLASEPSTSPLL